MSSGNEGTNALRAMSAGLAEAVRKAASSVVLVRSGHGYPGSGVAYTQDLILTSNHAVADTAEVALADGRTLAATVVGRDRISDLALLRLEEAAATPATPTPEEPAVGELVLALARPTEEGIQASLGVVGVARGHYEGWPGMALEEVMRTDATMFAGYSGGPLVDAEGRVVGINTFGSRPGFARMGSSLTIPVRRAWEIAAKLREQGSLKRGYLGIRSQAIELPEGAGVEGSQTTGLLIVGVEKDSPAQAGGLLVGDILFSFGGTPVEDHEDLLVQLASGVAGAPVSLRVIRAGKPVELSVTPADAAAAEARGEGEQARRRHRRG
jgi:S1-C subfamily serine protease